MPRRHRRELTQPSDLLGNEIRGLYLYFLICQPMNSLIFRQLFDEKTWTYTYIIADASSKEAVIIDPVRDQVERDLKLLSELGLTLTYILDTHIHADHIT